MSYAQLALHQSKIQVMVDEKNHGTGANATSCDLAESRCLCASKKNRNSYDGFARTSARAHERTDVQ
jgi:hypothetical protein